jgi:Peptidase A4 family
MRLPRLMLLSGTSVMAAGALVLGAGTAATTVGTSVMTTAHASYHRPSATFLAEARGALVKYLRDNHPQAIHAAAIGHHAGPANVTATGSYNWSGYADVASTDGTFTKVSGKWTTPAVTCTDEDTITSEWVGLDGYGSATVEQDGTIGWCFEDVPTYFTWYEMYPAGTIEVGTSLEPGDVITASVVATATGHYTLKLTDATNTANSFTEHATCAITTCLDLSAEWIAERPSFSIGIAPLADFNKWKLTLGNETANGTAGTIGSYSSVDSVQSVDATDSYALANPSALSGNNNTFTDTWLNSY